MSQSLSNILQGSAEVSVEAGQCVFTQGQRAENFLVVSSGSVTVFARSGRGKEVVLYHVTAGEMCILTTACLIGHTLYPAEGVANQATRARVIPALEFEKHLEESADFRQFVFRGLSERLAQVTRRFEDVVLKSVRQKLALFLISRAGPDGVVEATHDSVAREIGTAREVVSRHLKTMESEGLVSAERGKITVLDTMLLSRTT